MIEFVNGDLFNNDYELDAIGHGVNTLGVMGAGIAVEFKRRYPEMFKQYASICSRIQHDTDILGSVFNWDAPDGYMIYNLFTQGSHNGRINLATAKALEDSLKRMIILVEGNGFIERVGLPAIGSGLGGMPWEQAKEIMVKTCEKSHVEVKVFETYVPRKKKK